MLEDRTAADTHLPCHRTAGGGRASANRSITTNDPMRARADARSSAGRRVRDLYWAYLASISNPDDIARAQVLAAAELMVAAENARTKLLAGQGDVEQIVRLENLANRAVRRLNIKPGAEPPRLSLRDQLIAEAEARDEAKAAADDDVANLAAEPANTEVRTGEAMAPAAVPSESGRGSNG